MASSEPGSPCVLQISPASRQRQTVVYAHGPTNRSLRNLFLTWRWPAHRGKYDPDVIDVDRRRACCAVFVVGRLRSKQLVYIESLKTRVRGSFDERTHGVPVRRYVLRTVVAGIEAKAASLRREPGVIFATCGSSHYPFHRTKMEAAPRCRSTIFTSNTAQRPPPPGARSVAYMPFEEIVDSIGMAELASTHAGVGASFVLSNRHTPSSSRGSSATGRRVDDHEAELAEGWKSAGRRLLAHAAADSAAAVLSVPRRSRDRQDHRRYPAFRSTITGAPLTHAAHFVSVPLSPWGVQLEPVGEHSRGGRTSAFSFLPPRAARDRQRVDPGLTCRAPGRTGGVGHHSRDGDLTATRCRLDHLDGRVAVFHGGRAAVSRGSVHITTLGGSATVQSERPVRRPVGSVKS